MALPPVPSPYRGLSPVSETRSSLTPKWHFGNSTGATRLLPAQGCTQLSEEDGDQRGLVGGNNRQRSTKGCQQSKHGTPVSKQHADGCSSLALLVQRKIQILLLLSSLQITRRMGLFNNLCRYMHYWYLLLFLNMQHISKLILKKHLVCHMLPVHRVNLPS